MFARQPSDDSTRRRPAPWIAYAPALPSASPVETYRSISRSDSSRIVTRDRTANAVIRPLALTVTTSVRTSCVSPASAASIVTASPSSRGFPMRSPSRRTSVSAARVTPSLCETASALARAGDAKRDSSTLAGATAKGRSRRRSSSARRGDADARRSTRTTYIRAVNRALLMVVGALLVASCALGAPARRDVLLATTTSFQDSGLLDVLAADFEKRTGYHLRSTAVGTGAALAIGARGDADVVFVHAPEEELKFMDAGSGGRRVLVMHNDFVLVGPPGDPARIKGRDAITAFKTIAAAQATFISRGDNSGTDIFEQGLWRRAGISPSGAWYVQAATGMGQTLQIASEKNAYTLADRGTFLARRAGLRLEILVQRDPPLINVYHVITVNPQRYPKTNTAGANAFADYLVSPETQRLIGAFGVEKYGEQLFVPDAGKNESGLL